MVQGEVSFDPAAAGDVAKINRPYAGEPMERHVPEGSDRDPSERLPAVWTDLDGLREGTKDLGLATDGLLTAVADSSEGADPLPALEEAALASKARHRHFREDRRLPSRSARVARRDFRKPRG